MPNAVRRMKRRLRRGAKAASDAVIGAVAVGLLKGLRRVDFDRLADFSAAVLRRIGPLLPEHKIGRANLAAAFPEKSADEIEAILTGVWDNLGRMGAEFAHIDELAQYDPTHPERRWRIEVDDKHMQQFLQLANDGKPALVFAAHLANWELPAITAAKYGVDTAVLFRRPNIAGIDRWLQQTRGASMGELIETSLDAPVKLAEALARGAHVGMLVDQYYVRGVEVTFFGRRTRANPLLARLARHFDCPIHGVRIIRLADHRLRGEITEQIMPARDANGAIDIPGTMQIITNVIESWVREHPAQWLWLHRRWRPDDEQRP